MSKTTEVLFSNSMPHFLTAKASLCKASNCNILPQVEKQDMSGVNEAPETMEYIDEGTNIQYVIAYLLSYSALCWNYCTNSMIRRKLFVSKSYKHNDPDFTRMLQSVIFKMYGSPINPVGELSASRPYIVLTEDSWNWRKIRWEVSNVNCNQVPRADSKEFILVRDLRGGADGRVWMACTKSGIACVLKFAKLKGPYKKDYKEATKKLNDEVNAYLRQDPEMDVQVLTLCGRPVLLMQYFSQVDCTTEKTNVCDGSTAGIVEFFFL
jgi:hypothetical protein